MFLFSLATNLSRFHVVPRLIAVTRATLFAITLPRACVADRNRLPLAEKLCRCKAAVTAPDLQNNCLERDTIYLDSFSFLLVRESSFILTRQPFLVLRFFSSSLPFSLFSFSFARRFFSLFVSLLSAFFLLNWPSGSRAILFLLFSFFF